MPRQPRSYLKTSFFHILVQGINKSYIFDNRLDMKTYIKLMYKENLKCNIDIIAYCIMNNHAHLLLRAEKINDLSKYMQRINTQYGLYYNKKYNRVGYVFRDRYKSQGIYTEKQIYNCKSYIFNNPIKAGICKYPEEYEFSNYNLSNHEIKIEEMEEFNFIEDDEYKDIEQEELVKAYLKKNNIKLSEIKKYKYEFKRLVLILKVDKGMSYRKIAKLLKVDREILGKLVEN